MGWWARNRASPGGSRELPTLASAATVYVPDDIGAAYLDGTTQITFFQTPTIIPGRQLLLIGIHATGPEIVTSADTTTAYKVDLGAANITIAAQDILRIVQKGDGTWVRVSSINN